jgi:hypothetical protein
VLTFKPITPLSNSSTCIFDLLFAIERARMPSARELQHRRTHNLLLIQKLLGGRENASPFTLVLDSLEQSGRPLVKHIIKRAQVSNLLKICHEVSIEDVMGKGEERAWRKNLVNESIT